MITAGQIRAARGLIQWSQNELAEQSGLSVPTIKRMEGPIGPGRSSSDNVTAVRRALEAEGVEFTNGDAPGVKLRRDKGDQ
jgi:transcriptional regulator with XRE-family HTH domain